MLAARRVNPKRTSFFVPLKLLHQAVPGAQPHSWGCSPRYDWLTLGLASVCCEHLLHRGAGGKVVMFVGSREIDDVVVLDLDVVDPDLEIRELASGTLVLLDENRRASRLIVETCRCSDCEYVREVEDEEDALLQETLEEEREFLASLRLEYDLNTDDEDGMSYLFG